MNHCVKLKIKCVFPRQAEKGFSVEKGSSFSKGNRSPMQFFTEKQFSGRISFLSLRQPLRSGKDPQTVGC